MILIADSGSTKTDWVIINTNKEKSLRFETVGLNPDILTHNELVERLSNVDDLVNIKNEITEINFYGAGCGSEASVKKINTVFNTVFKNATTNIHEDMLAAVYAVSPKKEGIISILGTGSNSCYYDGKNIESLSDSLGYIIMDEASGNYFGKKLLRDYFYKQMPPEISIEFNKQFNLDTDTIKNNLYLKSNPNMYLASFAKFMFSFKDNNYIKTMIKNGFKEFFKFSILPYTIDKNKKIPLHFVGSIAFYFRDILEIVANEHQLEIHSVIRKPIESLVEYHSAF